MTSDDSPIDPSTVAGPSTENTFNRIGPYRILSRLGEGGMGVVFLAEQQLPHRRVAVKVIRAGMDTRQVVARFDVEREALAMMDHPNIAAVYEAGATSDGRPYFAMEYVAGVPITDYCDRHRLTTRNRLSLFLQVCAAIHHTHQKGVIHRDIKPSNILVTVVDNQPQPKVIDFGVAKAINPSVAALLLLAAFGAVMAVQSRRIAMERDTAARERDRAEAVSAFMRSLFEASDPDRSTGENVSARQLLDRGRQRLDRELVDQPQTRAALLHTIGRVYRILDLDDAAESALLEALKIRESATGRDRAGYADSLYELSRLGPRNNRYQGVPMMDEVLRLRREVFGPDHPSVAQALATMAVDNELAGKYDEAERYYKDAIAMAGRVDSLADQGLMKVNLAGLLIRRPRHPEAVELLKDAVAVLTRILGPEHTWVQGGLSNLSVSLARTGRAAEAEPVQREIVRVRQKVWGPGTFQVAMALHNLGNTLHTLGQLDESEQTLREAVAIHRKVRQGPHEQLGWAPSDLAWLLSDRGKYEEAERDYVESIDVFTTAKIPGDATAWSTAGLGGMYYSMQRFADAERLAREAIQIRITKVENGPGFAISKELLARVLCESGPSPDGEQHARDALMARQQSTPLEPADIAIPEAILGRCLAGAKRFDDAEKLLLGAHAKMAGASGSAKIWNTQRVRWCVCMTPGRNPIVPLNGGPNPSNRGLTVKR